MANELEISAQGDSLNIYAVVRRQSDGAVADVENEAFETWSDGSIGDYDIAHTSRGGDLYQADFPTWISAGESVRVQWYRRDGSTPATDDLLLAVREFIWTGQTLDSGSSVSLDSCVLTSLASVKRQLRITASTYDTILTELINSISQRVRTIAGKDFCATDYARWYSLPDNGDVVLENGPLLYLNIATRCTRQALDVSYSGSAINATVQVTDSGVRLLTTTAAGTTTTTDLSFADYPTISTMAAAISAVSDWTATLKNDGLSKQLVPRGGQYTPVGSTINLFAADPTQALSDYQLRSESGILSLGRARGVWDSDYWGGYSTGGSLNGQVVYGDIAAYPNSTRGLIYVEHRSGYETIPAGIDLLVREAVQRAFRYGLLNNALQSESIGDYSYTLADQSTQDQAFYSRVHEYGRVAVA